MQTAIGIVAGVTAAVVCFELIQPLTFIYLSKGNIGVSNQERFYHDLDNNGSSEIISKSAIGGKTNIHITSDTNFNGQGNLKGEWPEGFIPFTGDYDGNQIKEIYGVTLHNDSIFLTAFNYLEYDRPIFERFLLKTKSDTEDLHGGWPGHFHDFNDDGFRELVFTINAGYAIDPRVIILYDIKNDKLIHTPINWGIYSAVRDIVDLDGDGAFEIIASSATPENIHTNNYIYGDKISYVFILDSSLNHHNPPFTTSAHSNFMFFEMNGGYYIHSVPRSNEEKMEVFRWENEWVEVDITYVPKNYLRVNLNKALQWRGRYMAAFFDNKIDNYDFYFTNEEFEFTPVPKPIRYGSPLIADLDGDSLDDIAWTTDGELIIYTGEKWKKSVIPIDSKAKSLSAGIRFGEIRLSMDNQSGRYLFQIKKNPLYANIWLLAVGTGLIGFFTSGFIYQYRKYRRDSFNQRLYSLQLKSIKNHVDPHFTSNILDSLKVLLVKDDESEHYFDKFTSMIRHNLMKADNIESTIKDELRLAENYLSLEAFRLKDKFSFRVFAEEHLQEVTLPKMLIQTHLENAVKHGVAHLNDRKGYIELLVQERGEVILISLTDNGVGRNRSRHIGSESTGKGTDITEKIIDLYNKLGKTKIDQKIVDETKGTRVEIRIGFDRDKNLTDA